MVTSVQRVAVLRFTRFAHLKEFHRGILTVIGQIVDDGVAHSAVGTGDERVAVTAIGRIKKFFFTCFTDADIGRNAYGTLTHFIRLNNTEIIKNTRLYTFSSYGFYRSKRRTFLFNALKKIMEFFRGRIDNDLHTFSAVGNRTGKFITCGKLINEGTEPNTLYGSGNTYFICLNPIRFLIPYPGGTCHSVRAHSSFLIHK